MVETAKKQVINRQFNGEVVSAKGGQTIQVLVRKKVTHPKYHKQYSVSSKYAVHDEKNQAKVGDLVVFQACRPMSKTKRWRLVKIEKQA